MKYLIIFLFISIQVFAQGFDVDTLICKEYHSPHIIKLVSLFDEWKKECHVDSLLVGFEFVIGEDSTYTDSIISEIRPN